MRPFARTRLPPMAAAMTAAASPKTATAAAAATAPISWCLRRRQQPQPICRLHAAATNRLASVDPLHSTGPPPPPPPPVAADEAAAARVAEERAVRIARRRAQAEASQGRFYKHVDVIEEDGGEFLQVSLDKRTLRHPTSRAVVRLPSRKRVLAHALAVEWDQLATIRQAGQGHRIPLTSLVCRALDLEENKALREPLINNLLRYLDTDSLLCWEPAHGAETAARAILGAAPSGSAQKTLRQLQEETVAPILAWLAVHAWPGVEVRPVLGDSDSDSDSSSLLPRPHPPETRAAVAAWLGGLDGFTLAAAERATLAGKSLVLAARLTGGWQQAATTAAAADVLSVDEAVAAANLETGFQTAQWGEVEDTHDVDREDMRRHFGSVVLLVAE